MQSTRARRLPSRDTPEAAGAASGGPDPSPRAGAPGSPAPDGDALGLSVEAEAFVRFCYRRRPVGWPDLYDEMCAVASRGAFNGWSYIELAEHGIEFTLPNLVRFALLADRIAEEERGAPTASSDEATGSPPRMLRPRSRREPLPQATLRGLPVTRRAADLPN